jgi:hypothetical protein
MSTDHHMFAMSGRSVLNLITVLAALGFLVLGVAITAPASPMGTEAPAPSLGGL